MISTHDFSNFIPCFPIPNRYCLFDAKTKENFALITSAQPAFFQYLQLFLTGIEDEKTQSTFSPLSDNGFWENLEESEANHSSQVKSEFHSKSAKIEGCDLQKGLAKLEVKQEPTLALIGPSQVHEIVGFIVNNLFLSTPDAFSMQQMRYSHDKRLLDLFRCLFEKYSETSKSHDDMRRYIIRQAMSFCKNQVRISQKMTLKAAETILCRRYFGLEACQNEKNLSLNYFLPYKKNSRNKTANKIFIFELFSSPSFCEDYLKFLEDFDLIFQIDHAKRISRFVKLIMKGIQDGRIENVKRCKRLPWLEIWFQETKRLAFTFLEVYGNTKTNLEAERFSGDSINQTNSQRENE